MPTNAPLVATTNTPAVESAPTNAWSFSVSVSAYFVPDEDNYAQPTFAADRGALHLEARYNYENLRTGSAWVGYNLGGGDRLAWEFTPMLGGIFGDTAGVAPGFRGSLSRKRLELFSEGEYVFDTRHSADSFFYSWSELSFAPADWCRVGLVAQRTLAYQTDRDIQRGVLAGLSYKRADLTAYVLNPDESKPTVVLTFGFHF